MKSSGVILAGGFSRRFGQDKGLVKLGGKPLVLHVVDRVSEVVDEIVVVVSSNLQKERFEGMLENIANVVVDKNGVHSPLIGALAGFENAKGDYTLLLPCDTPFISIQIVQLLLDICVNRGAVIPKWPDGKIEPLQAVYHTQSALTAVKNALERRNLTLRSMISRLREVRYVSTMILRRIDGRFLTFFNINTREDLKRAESLME